MNQLFNDKGVIVVFADKIAQKLQTRNCAIEVVYDYCVKKRIFLKGIYRIYLPKSDFKLICNKATNGYELRDVAMQAWHGEMWLSGEGFTTFAAKIKPEESFKFEYWFTPEQVSDGQLNGLGYEKINQSVPPSFYYFNEMSYEKFA